MEIVIQGTPEEVLEKATLLVNYFGKDTKISSLTKEEIDQFKSFLPKKGEIVWQEILCQNALELDQTVKKFATPKVSECWKKEYLVNGQITETQPAGGKGLEQVITYVRLKSDPKVIHKVVQDYVGIGFVTRAIYRGIKL